MVCRSKSGCWGRGLVTYWVDLQIPRLAWCVQVDYDFFILEADFLEGDVCAVSPGAQVVGVEDDLWGGHDRLMCGNCVEVPKRLGKEVI